MEKIRIHFVFDGRVQGVGFRYRAYYAAMSHGITGWVKNCDDGTVEMEAEGSQTEIEAVIEEISKSTFVRIESIDKKRIPLKNDRSFKISGY